MEIENAIKEWVIQNPVAVAQISDLMWVGIAACLGAMGGYATGFGMKAMDKKHKKNDEEAENRHLGLMFVGAVASAFFVAAAQLP